jgi:putative Holliday junction resolvase
VTVLKTQPRILGVDFGRARIGLALSDELQLLAHPLKTIAASEDAAKQIAEIVRDNNVARVVVGLPRHMSGEIGQAAKEALGFTEKLRDRLGCEVVTWDERLTTVAANRALRNAGRKTKDSKGVIDQVAAQMILQGYLDSLQTTDLGRQVRGLD